MVDEDFGEATIVYDDPDDGTVEETVPNEHVAYFQDHWILKTGEDEAGRDTIVRIPMTRVHRVERTVESFEEEVSTLIDQIQSVADDITGLLPFGGGERGRRRQSEDEDPVEIAVEDDPTTE